MLFPELKDHGVLGYDVREVGDGQRILAAAIVEQFVVGADGSLIPLTEGSTRPVASTWRTRASSRPALQLRHAVKVSVIEV